MPLQHISRAICIAFVSLLSACDKTATESTVFTDEQCKVIELVDSENAGVLRGIEDLALDPKGEHAILSVYDRWATEKAARAKAERLPHGGLYRLSLAELPRAPDRIRVERLTSGFEHEEDFRPHGIDVYASANGTLVASITRSYRRGNTSASRWEKRVVLDIFRLEGSRAVHLLRMGAERFCNANDVSFLNENQLLVSSDGTACRGFSKTMEQLRGSKSGSVFLVRRPQNDNDQLASITEIVSDIYFANGIAVTSESDRAFIAATRGREILEIDGIEGFASERTRGSSFEVPGHPDNLTQLPEGRLLAALHPNLMRLGLYRYRQFGVSTAPSLIAEIDPARAQSRILFSDRTGHMFSAATSAIMGAGHLIAGSVADAGVLVCDMREQR